MIISRLFHFISLFNDYFIFISFLYHLFHLFHLFHFRGSRSSGPTGQKDEHVPGKMKLYAKLHINTSGRKMPPTGIEPATFAFAAQTITQLTKWADGFFAYSEGNLG